MGPSFQPALALFPAPLLEACAAHWRHHIASVSSVSDFQMAVHGTLEGMGLRPQLEQVTPDGLFSVDMCLRYKGRLVAVEADGPTHFMAAGPRYRRGHTVLRDLLLASRGYVVLAVPFDRWSRCGGEEERREYLAQQLEQALQEQASSQVVSTASSQAGSDGAGVGAGAEAAPRRRKVPVPRAGWGEREGEGAGHGAARVGPPRQARAKGSSSSKQSIARLAAQGRPGLPQRASAAVVRPMQVPVAGAQEVDMRGSRRRVEPGSGAAVEEGAGEEEGGNVALPSQQRPSLLEYDDDEFDVLLE